MEIDYSKYTLSELDEVRQTIDEEKYPERVKEIEFQIAEKTKNISEHENIAYFTESEKYSTFGPRFVAAIIDGIIVTILSAALLFIGKQLATIVGNNADRLDTIIGYIDSVQFVAYSVLLHGLFGQTLGKMVVSVKVVDANTEQDINFKQAVLRDCVPIFSVVFMLISSFYLSEQAANSGKIPGWYFSLVFGFGVAYLVWHLLEIITMLFNKKRRALHDFIAGVVVINIERK